MQSRAPRTSVSLPARQSRLHSRVSFAPSSSGSGVGVGITDGIGVGLTVALGVGLGVTVALGVGEGVGDGVGVGVTVTFPILHFLMHSRAAVLLFLCWSRHASSHGTSRGSHSILPTGRSVSPSRQHSPVSDVVPTHTS